MFFIRRTIHRATALYRAVLLPAFALLAFVCLLQGSLVAQSKDARGPAPMASISGRVTTPQGRGVGRIWVHLGDLIIGHVQSAQTRGDGSYVFTNVPLYSHYSVTPRHRLYTFSPGIQGFSLVEELRNVNFTATRR